MSAVPLTVGAEGTRSVDMLSAQLIDAIAEAVVSPPDPHARSATICSVIREMYETMAWLHGADSPHEELASLRRVVEEAAEHQRRMSTLRDLTVADPVPPPGR